VVFIRCLKIIKFLLAQFHHFLKLLSHFFTLLQSLKKVGFERKETFLKAVEGALMLTSFLYLCNLLRNDPYGEAQSNSDYLASLIVSYLLRLQPIKEC